MLTQGPPPRWGCSSYRIGTFSGMFMMWSSAWSPGFCCRSRQLLREDRVSVMIFMKRFCDESSRPSVQSLEPGLVPAKPPTFHLSSLHFIFINIITLFYQLSALGSHDSCYGLNSNVLVWTFWWYICKKRKINKSSVCTELFSFFFVCFFFL